ncbi:Hypothetical protein PENO1_093840 [Penicillium occitanis (nom. inval.)]|nr:Hypothetical protein PENO1_093840 [Penicillium occitanis (nom. inval.)]PCG91972.1 hypothetical protein PENOC_094840 [Penicillium occitanis (nom. inval.)]
MPSTASERSDAPANSSKTSLLWAYQLRREHVHLVDRIDDMNTQLVSSVNKSQTCEQNLSTLESLVKTLQAENYTLKNEVTLVRTKLTARIEDITQQITHIVSGDNAAKDATKQLELDFKGMGHQVSVLSKSVSELKGELVNVANQKGSHTTQEVAVEPTQDNTELAKVESVLEQIETRPRRIVILSLKKREADHPEHSPEPHAEAEITSVPDSMISQTALSTLSTLTDLPDSIPPPNPYDPIFKQIYQNGRTTSDYLAFTSELRSQLPRRKQEGHIVEAFFDGITEDDADGAAFKASLEDYLDKAGWIWSNLEVFCNPRALRNKRRAIYNTRARSRANALATLKEDGSLQV